MSIESITAAMATVMRIRIGNHDAARIRTQAADRGGDLDAEADGDGIDERAVTVNMLSSSGALAHKQLSERLRASLTAHSPSIEVRDTAAATAAAVAGGPPQKNYSKEPDGALGQAIGRVSVDDKDSMVQRVRADFKAKGDNYESQPGAGRDFAGENNVLTCEECSTADAGKAKADPTTKDAASVENTHKPGRELMRDDQYSSAKVQRRAGREAMRLKSDDLVQERAVGLQGKVGFEECADTVRLKEKEDELNFLPAQRALPGPRTAIMARKDDGLEVPSCDPLYVCTYIYLYLFIYIERYVYLYISISIYLYMYVCINT